MMKYNIFYDLESKIKKKIIRYSSDTPIKKVKILLAYSGGVDSSVLLHIVNSLSIKMGFKYDFIYINHNMNLNFNNILDFGNSFSIVNNSNFIYHRLQKNPNSNKESFFREYRYDYFNNLIKKNKYNFIFTAHHYDDQIETLYMKTRGAYDWTKLIGIREYKEFLRRPLLKVKKKIIIDYAIKNGIVWFFDDTNNDIQILRNYVRHRILPNRSTMLKLLLIFFNKYSKIQFYLFRNKLHKITKRVLLYESNFIILKKKSFMKLNSKYKKLFLQSVLKKYNNGDYLINANSKWDELWNYLSKNKNLKDFILNKNIFINNSRDLIIIKNQKKYQKKIDLINDVIWENYIFKVKEMDSSSLEILDKNNFYIRPEIFKEGLFVRNWNIGDYYIDHKNSKKRVSRLFLKNKFNNYEKMCHPIIVNSNDKILWIPGLVNSSLSLNLSNNNCIKISKEILN